MIDILLATYNGAAYIREQIDSILQQTVADWHLLVHDDGSTDGTVDIVREYVQADKRIRLVEDGERHLGVAKNFLHLLKYSTAEYAMFCDQDDVWIDNKVEVMLGVIADKDNTRPQAAFSNAYLWNAEQGVLSDKNTLTYPRTLEALLFLNTGIQGAASIFNAKMREFLLVPLRAYAMHDHVLTLTAITFGEVDYVDRPLMYYRQHDRNVTGNAPGSMMNKLRLMKQHAHIPVVDRTHYEGVAAFYEAFKEKMPMSKRKVFEVFLSLPKLSVWKRVYLIVKHRFMLFDSTALLLAKMCVRKFY